PWRGSAGRSRGTPAPASTPSGCGPPTTAGIPSRTVSPSTSPAISTAGSSLTPSRWLSDAAPRRGNRQRAQHRDGRQLRHPPRLKCGGGGIPPTVHQREDGAAPPSSGAAGGKLRGDEQFVKTRRTPRPGCLEYQADG